MDNPEYGEDIPDEQPRMAGVLYLRNRHGALGRFNIAVEEYDQLTDGTWAFLVQTVEDNIKIVRTAGRR